MLIMLKEVTRVPRKNVLICKLFNNILEDVQGLEYVPKHPFEITKHTRPVYRILISHSVAGWMFFVRLTKKTFVYYFENFMLKILDEKKIKI